MFNLVKEHLSCFLLAAAQSLLPYSLEKFRIVFVKF
jgi:hypothetical protein